MEKCAICGKKLGGFNGRYPIKDTELELCAICMGKIDYIEASFNKNVDLNGDVDAAYNNIKIDLEKIITDKELVNTLWGYYKDKYEAKIISEEKKAQEEAYKANVNEINTFIENKRAELQIPVEELVEVVKENYNDIDYNKVLAINPQYEYDVVTLRDDFFGSTNTQKLKSILVKYALEGWRLAHVFTNELGKDALAINSIGMNSTKEETVLIFERMIRKPLE